ncbi:twin-arginine translocase TatA/TatE family subunit [Halobacteriovorax sp.]|uniref:twin-arginine translocase TatA/TatE family subunit n=1 Tax=Halobacteriovorax sp. TaxID=2020862 RepID=UPI00356AD471
MGFGVGESLVILAVVLLLFGGKRLPQLGSSLGKAIQNFKKGMDENDTDDAKKDEDKKITK